MREPTRTSAAQRAKLAIVLKQNMARRKAVAGHQSSVLSETSTAALTDQRLAAHGEPHASQGQRSVGGNKPPTIKGEA